EGLLTATSRYAGAMTAFGSPGQNARRRGFELAGAYGRSSPSGPFMLTLAREAQMIALPADVASVVSLFEAAASSSALAFVSHSEAAAFLGAKGEGGEAARHTELAFEGAIALDACPAFDATLRTRLGGRYTALTERLLT